METIKTNASADPVKEAAAISPEDQKNQEFFRAVEDNKLLLEALNAGTLACLPDASGNTDTRLSKNPETGTHYKGISGLLINAWSKANGFKEPTVVTFNGLQRINEKLALPYSDRSIIVKGSKPFSIVVKKLDPNSPEGEKNYSTDYVKVFNVDQLTNPQNLEHFAVLMHKESVERAMEKAKAEGKEYKKPFEAKKEPKTVEATSADPVEYLAQWKAASVNGNYFKASPEIAGKFKENFKAILDKEQNRNPWLIYKVGFDADARCKEILKESVKQAKEKKAEKEHKKSADEPEMCF